MLLTDQRSERFYSGEWVDVPDEVGTMTPSADAVGFPELLADNRKAMERLLKAELPDVTHPDLHWHLDADEIERLASVDDEALEKRAELIRIARLQGLTGRDIAVALLRSRAQLLRPTLEDQGCGCHRCGRPS